MHYIQSLFAVVLCVAMGTDLPAQPAPGKSDTFEMYYYTLVNISNMHYFSDRQKQQAWVAKLPNRTMKPDGNMANQDARPSNAKSVT